MADFKIEAQQRTIVGKKVKRLRWDGLVPATIYGPKIDPVNVQIPYRPLEVALMHAGGTNLIDITVDGTNHVVLARDVQRDVIKGTILHADFVAIDMKSKITADIPVNLVGESPIVEAREGILLTGTNTVTIETMPDKLMNQIDVDLSVLKEIGDTITVADLVFDDDVISLNDPEEMIARVSQSSAARAELLEAIEEGEEDGLETSAEPEVISRGKEDEEDEE